MEDTVNKLPRAPLQEVIFELLWEIEVDQVGQPYDSNFDLAQGAFAKAVRPQFPIIKKTIPDGVPEHLFYPKTVRQFWKNKDVWPVLQIGPGMFALNDTEANYEWNKTFYPMIKFGIESLEDSYEQSLQFKAVNLRYIDAVEVGDLGEEGVLEFINKNFKVNVSNNFNHLGRASNININQTFTLENNNKLSLIISDGKTKLNKPAIIWQIHIVNESKMLKEEVLNWANNAHSITSQTFREILTEDFYDSFK